MAPQRVYEAFIFVTGLSEMQNIKEFGPKAIDQDRAVFHTSRTKRVLRPSEKPARVQRGHAIRLDGLAGRLGWAAPRKLHQGSCTSEAATEKLQQRSCAKKTAPWVHAIIEGILMEDVSTPMTASHLEK